MPTPLSYRARDTAATLLDRVPVIGAGPLAEPPPGSGLAPVMGETGLPVIGRTLKAMQQTLAFAREGRARHGDVFWSTILGIRVVVVLGPDNLETVFANRDGAFSNREGWDYFIGPFFERGVMLMDGDEHRHHRRIMQQAFKRERLIGYLDRMNAAIARGLAQWPNGPGFELHTHTKQLTLDVATDVFMGSQLGAGSDRLNTAFVDCVVGGQAIVRADVRGGRWHRGLEGRRVLAEWFRSQIEAKRAGDGDDLFSVLCHAESEDGERFTDEDVVNHMIFTMMAAHDTSTITLAMMGFQLARHPEWQERVRKESRALGTDAIGYDDLDALPALDLVFRETLRMNAPVGMLARQALSDTELDGRYIPAGTRLMLGLYPTMRMEPWWHDPDTFDPERFTPERAEDQSHRYAWMPFGGNVHKCIGMHFGGMEVKAIMHQLLLRHRLHVAPDYAPPIDYATGPFPGDGLPVELRPLS